MTRKQTRSRQEPGRTVEIGPVAILAAVLLLGLAVVAGAWQLGRLRAARAPAPIPAAPAVATEPSIGAAIAPVTIAVYSDYRCPNCHQFATEVLPWLRTTWIERGFVRVLMRDFAIRGEDSVRAAEAAHCAGEQGAYWPYHDALFAAADDPDPAVDADALARLAREVGLDGDALRACVESGRYRPVVESSTSQALARGFEGTPTYLINGRQVEGAIEVDRWEELFRAYEADLGAAIPGSDG